MERAEDAGVFKLNEQLAIVQTVDFFTPIVDDPYDFGRIAAANSLSDVYAMGGRPVTALNVVCFPKDQMDFSILREVLKGGLDTMHQADVILLGGHTVDDPELKYGLSVTGTIHPDQVVHNNTAKAGDVLVLTKNLGTGIISTAIKGGVASKEAVSAVTESMVTLNKTASEVMCEVGVNACKDITGFGLLGHACEMIEGMPVGFKLDSAAVPVFPYAIDYYNQGIAPGGIARNRDYRLPFVDFTPAVPTHLRDIFFDPQTSGGLLIAVPKAKASRLLTKLQSRGVSAATVIGEVTAENPGRIRVY
jgi:selenide, water dikinase